MYETTKKIGDDGELQAIEYLKSQDYFIVETNFKFGKIGELDIVTQKGGITVFFEIKKRNGDTHGLAVESLTLTKKIRILRSIEYYCLMRGVDFEKIQFDFLSIQDGKIEHFQNVELYN